MTIYPIIKEYEYYIYKIYSTHIYLVLVSYCLMKILHINDMAGVACILAKYQRLSGIESKVLSPNKIDKFGILKYYKDYVEIIDPINFVDYCISEAKDADVIHVHSMEEVVVKMHKTFGNSKKIVLHYHGTDIRGLKNKNNPAFQL